MNTAKYPWDQINVGEDFPVDSTNLRSMVSLACQTGKKLGKVFRAYRTESGIRVYRAPDEACNREAG